MTRKKTNKRSKLKSKVSSKKALNKKGAQNVDRKVTYKKKVTREESSRTVYARAKYINMSAQKVRLVADLVRGMNALEAVERLRFVRKSANLPVRKVIESAIANASNNFEMDKKNLIITEVYVNDAPILKRWRAGSRGRGKKILKRNCHIIIGLREE